MRELEIVYIDCKEAIPAALDYNPARFPKYRVVVKSDSSPAVANQYKAELLQKFMALDHTTKEQSFKVFRYKDGRCEVKGLRMVERARLLKRLEVE